MESYKHTKGPYREFRVSRFKVLRVEILGSGI